MMKSEEIIKDFFDGTSFDSYEYLGAHVSRTKTVFRTYAPGASGVNIFGDFNGWTEEPMIRDDRGFWSFESKNAKEGQLYKYVIYGQNGYRMEHADPYAFGAELRPGSASKITDINKFKFTDEAWMKARKAQGKGIPYIDKPLSVYEMHMGAFIRNKKDENGWFNYRDLAEPVIDHVKKSGFTHIELMPITEYPYDGSWGYQVTGFFAPTCRYGSADDLKYFINECHNAGLGVIMDYVPVHFAVDDFALKRYDSTELFEYYPQGQGSQWGTCMFNHGRKEVSSFLMSVASYWIKEYHFDGLRTDAVSCLIYNIGEEGRGENGAGMHFIRTLNTKLKEKYPDVLLFAEDSSAWQGGVTKPVKDGGLGFDYKWNMGWMYDSLHFMSLAPENRPSEYHKMTFSMWYFYTERFILSLSHDEVVGGKGTILNKIPGTEEEKFAQLKVYYVYMMMHPGKKLQFMGNEVGEETEWNEGREVEFDLLENPLNKGLNSMLITLNEMYASYEAFSKDEYVPLQFEWLHCEQDGRALYVMKRHDKSGSFAAVLNFSDKPVKDFEFRAVKLPDDTDDAKDTKDTNDTKISKAAKKSKKIKEETWKAFIDTSWKEYDGTKVKKEAVLKSKDGIITTDIGAYEAVIYKIM